MLTSDTIIITDYTEVELSSQEEPEEKLEELLDDEAPAADPALDSDKPADQTSHDVSAATTAQTDTSAATNQPDGRLRPNATDETDGPDGCPEAGSDITTPQDIQASVSDVSQKPPARRGRGRPKKSTESTDKRIAVKTPRRRERAAPVGPEDTAEER